MSTHQQSKPRRANQSMTEELGRPSTCKSKVGCDAIDEPCTKSMVPRGARIAAAFFEHEASRWLLCRSNALRRRIAAAAFTCSRLSLLRPGRAGSRREQDVWGLSGGS